MNSDRYKEVLLQLDEQSDILKLNFPMFGAAYYYVDSRTSVFADKKYWGILIEVIEDSAGGIGHRCNLNSVYRFGNCLSRPLGLNENRLFYLTSDGDDEPFLDSNYCINPNAQTMKLRGHLVPIPRDPHIYESKGIKLVNLNEYDPKAAFKALEEGRMVVDKNDIYFVALLRTLTPEYRKYFFLSEEEKQAEFLQPIPKLLQLEEWRHPQYDENNILELPSKCEAFQLIAKVIATCDPSVYKPTEKPNTHWSNWLTADKYL
jgi:hypothetical protein